MSHGSETKRRLLLSKWRGELKTLREKQDAHDEQIAERDWEIEDMSATLVAVKYWLHDGLVHKRLVSDPRAILRKVEDVLG